MHWESCRKRMEEAIQTASEGRERKRKQDERENERIAAKVQISAEAEEMNTDRGSLTTGGRGEHGQKSQRSVEDVASEESIQKKARENYMDDTDMEISMAERLMQEDMRWDIMGVNDMCMMDDPAVLKHYMYFDENTWEPLDPFLVQAAETDEMARFAKIKAYSYADRSDALSDPHGKFVKVRWVRTNKGTAERPKIRCRLAAQELAHGHKMDELFAGTPSLTSVKLVLAS